MEIKLGIGIGQLKFGMTSVQVIEILGLPSRTFWDEDAPEDEKIEIFEWNEHKLRLSFYHHHSGKLGYFRIKNPNIILLGRKMMDQPIESVMSLFESLSITDWEVEDFQFWRCHFSESYWISLHEEYGEVESFELGVPFIDNENYNWPK